MNKHIITSLWVAIVVAVPMAIEWHPANLNKKKTRQLQLRQKTPLSART